jgi:hypothetical protein
MDLIQLLIVLIIVGVVLYFVNHALPMDPPIRMLINVVVVIILLLWLLGLFGYGRYNIGVPHVAR